MIDTSLLTQLPPLRRARGDRLYANDRHWVDLWKQNGAWLLGHRPEGAAREWKNQIDKGLAAVFPSRWTSRLEKHLNDLPGINKLLGPAATLYLFPNFEAAREALQAWKGLPFTFQDAKTTRWRPWADGGLSHGQDSSPWAGVMLPILPAGPAQAVPVLISGANDGLFAPLVAVSDAAALVRAAVTLARKFQDPTFAAALKLVQKGFDRHLAPTGLFRRDGIWLEATCVPEDYERLFGVFLAAGFVLSPDQDQESLLPLEVSEGEWKALRGACDAFLNDTPEATS